MLFLVKNFRGDLDMPIFTEGIKQKAEVLATGLGWDEGFDVVEGTDGLAGETRRDQSANEDEKRGGGGGEVVAVHFEDELPSDVVLADLGDDVDEEVEGVGGEGWVGEGLGVVEEGEGNFGIVLEAEERVVEEVGGESDAVELERGLHGVEGVVVVEEDLRYQFGVVLGCWVGE